MKQNLQPLQIFFFSDEKVKKSEKSHTRTVFIKNSPEEFRRFGVKNVPKEFFTHLKQQRRPSKASDAFANVEETDLIEFNSAIDNSINSYVNLL